jgi:hypothetical protein
MTRLRARADRCAPMRSHSAPRAFRAFVIASIVGSTACADSETGRLRSTTKASYDKTSGRLTEITYDANRNGRIDTWTEMDGSRALRSRIDRNEDGRLDRWEYYDSAGRLTKVGLSRADDGRPDAWAYAGVNGRIERIEVSSIGDDTKIDRWEYYGPPPSGSANEVLVRVEEDTNRDGRKDKWERYEAGALLTAEFDENADGRPDRRLTYRGSELVLIEHTPDASGRYTSVARVE